MHRRTFLKASVLAAAPAVLPAGVAAATEPARPNFFPAAAALNSDGRLEVFAEFGPEVLHIWQHSGGGWSDWHSLGLPLGPEQDVAGLAAARNADGRLEIFLTSLDPAGEVLHMWQDHSPDNGWSRWESLGGATSNFAVGTNADGRLELFQVTYSGEVQHRWQTTPNGGWSGWYELDQVGRGSVQVARAADNRLQVFVASNNNGAMYTARQDPRSGSGWSGFAVLDFPPGLEDLSIGVNQDGRLELFTWDGGVDTSGGPVYHMFETGNGWSDWISMGGQTTGPVQVGKNKDGRLEIFYNAWDGIHHNWQTTPNGGWSGWYSLGGGEFDLGVPAVGSNADGRLEIFPAAWGAAYHSWQTTPNGGWSGWYRL